MRCTRQNMTEHATYVTELDGTCDVWDGTWQNMRCMGRNMAEHDMYGTEHDMYGTEWGEHRGNMGEHVHGEHGWDGPVIEATSGKTRDVPIAALV